MGVTGEETSCIEDTIENTTHNQLNRMYTEQENTVDKAKTLNEMKLCLIMKKNGTKDILVFYNHRTSSTHCKKFYHKRTCA